jgi:hypothetical protein
MAEASANIPHLVDTGRSKQLVVKGKPFLMRAGELQNSSLTSPEYMKPVWQKMADTNINTLLGCVTWEMIEPEEDRFDFSVLDEIILAARNHSMHLVLLWFGSFKNGKSNTYLVPCDHSKFADRLWLGQDSLPMPQLGSRQITSGSLGPSCAGLAVV